MRSSKPDYSTDERGAGISATGPSPTPQLGRNLVGVASQTSPKRHCVFCDDPGEITPEHMIPSWMVSDEKSSGHLYVRESGGPNYEPRRHAREGPERHFAANGPCVQCNSGWMNDMDHGVLNVLDPQLMRGKLVELTRAKKAALAAWDAAADSLAEVDEGDALAQSRDLAQMHHEDRAGVNALIRG
jgi:hypothetical protein